MDLFHLSLTSATLLCSLVAGLTFTFAVVAMPGIGSLNDRQFLQSFQAMDRVIQNQQPLFLLVWVGSFLALVTACLVGIRQLEGTNEILLGAAFVVYLLGVQVPTASVNIPLNNQVQALDLVALDEPTVAAARKTFEGRWTRWNSIRTVFAILTAAILIMLVLRL